MQQGEYNVHALRRLALDVEAGAVAEQVLDGLFTVSDLI